MFDTDHKHARLLSAIVLASVLTLALFYASFYLPEQINTSLEGVGLVDPWSDPSIQVNWPLVNLLETAGPILFVIVVGLIVAGLLLKKKAVTILSVVAFYLPVFSMFAFTMTLLFAGIGALRALWLPLIDRIPFLLHLGDCVLLPALVLAPLSTIGVALITLVGFIILFWGTATWFYGKFGGEKIVRCGAYKYCRHPQYFSFLLLSYAWMLWYSRSFWSMPEPTFIWLLSAIIIVGLALQDEINMVKKHGDAYAKYRNKTPFFWLPRKLLKLFGIPMWWLLGKRYPENNREMLSVIVVYLIIFMLLSAPTTAISCGVGAGNILLVTAGAAIAIVALIATPPYFKRLRK